MKRVRPILARQGGKSSLLKYLLPLVPADAQCYVEVFGGGAALMLAREKPQAGCVEVYNDFDKELVNAFLQAKNHPEELIRELSLRPNSRANFASQRQACGRCLTEIQRAARFLHQRMISFGADGKSFGVQKKIGGNGACGSMKYLHGKIADFAARFDRVSVECLDWRRCLDLYDKESTFFFIDLPYCGGAQGAYASFTEENFREIAARLATLRGRWLLTTSDSPAMREIFAGHAITAVHRAKRIAAANKNVDRYHELIISDKPMTNDR